MSGEDSKRFVKAGKVESSAAEAKAAVEGAGSAELEDAENIGRARQGVRPQREARPLMLG
jgi:hypothetical protein